MCITVLRIENSQGFGSVRSTFTRTVAIFGLSKHLGSMIYIGGEWPFDLEVHWDNASLLENATEGLIRGGFEL